MTPRADPTGSMAAALAVEWLKLRRSPVAWTAGIAIVVLVPLVSLGGYALARAGASGPSATKARSMLVGEGWDALWCLAGQALPVSLLLGTGIVGSWCVGREFTDRTVGGLYATTVRREWVVAAKLLLVTMWATASSAVAATEVLIGGTALGLSPRDGFAAAVRGVAVGLLVAVSALPTAWFASARRGYLAGIAATLALLVLAQLAIGAGTGAWVPWAAPVFWAGAAGPAAAAQVGALQLALPGLSGLVAAVAVVRWWRRAELGNAPG